MEQQAKEPTSEQQAVIDFMKQQTHDFMEPLITKFSLANPELEITWGPVIEAWVKKVESVA